MYYQADGPPPICPQLEAVRTYPFILSLSPQGLAIPTARVTGPSPWGPCMLLLRTLSSCARHAIALQAACCRGLPV